MAEVESWRPNSTSAEVAMVSGMMEHLRTFMRLSTSSISGRMQANTARESMSGKTSMSGVALMWVSVDVCDSEFEKDT